MMLMKTEHKTLLKWLAANENLRQALADTIRENGADGVLKVIDPEPDKDPVIDAAGCKNMGELLNRHGPNGPALEVFQHCLERPGWQDRANALELMPLKRTTYRPEQLFMEITVYQYRGGRSVALQER
jgi:hypothetical protein